MGSAHIHITTRTHRHREINEMKDKKIEFQMVKTTYLGVFYRKHEASLQCNVTPRNATQQQYNTTSLFNVFSKRLNKTYSARM